MSSTLHPAGPSPATPVAQRPAARRIRAARERLGDSLLLLAHFYQRDEVVEHADFVGDSFQLARWAAEHPEARHIVFCGVHFMAETADILSGADQSVHLPVPGAGCPMADMARLEQVEACWDQLHEALGAPDPEDARVQVVPVTYMNSSADIKAFCGARGGIVCTSSNADAVLDWCFERGQQVLFLPDANLGTNSALKRGIEPGQILTWDPTLPMGGQSADALRDSRIVVWDGHCPIHVRFTADHVRAVRSADPTVRVVVHPECTPDVVAAADGTGSTDYIVREIGAATAPAAFAIGTEASLVSRLAHDHPTHRISHLDPAERPCPTMNVTGEDDLADLLDAIDSGQAPPPVRVPESIARDARVALSRMLEVH